MKNTENSIDIRPMGAECSSGYCTPTQCGFGGVYTLMMCWDPIKKEYYGVCIC